MNFRTFLTIVMLVIVSPIIQADNMPSQTKDLFAQAEVPIYPGAVFCIGDPQTGTRLATGDKVEKVRKWYQQQLSSWNIFNEFGLWALVDGPVNSMGDLMMNNNIHINENAELPGWHQLAPEMTTEILVSLPRSASVSAHESDSGNVIIIPVGDTPKTDLAVQDNSPIELKGVLNSGEDSEFDLGSYYYLMDAEYQMYPVIYSDDLQWELERRLSELADSERNVRIKGKLITLEDGRILGFDRSTPIEIYH